jgi:acetamidase/formamidase
MEASVARLAAAALPRTETRATQSGAQALRSPRYVTQGPVTDHFDKKGYEVTTGIGPDLMAGARMADSEMVELLSKRYGYAPLDACMLCSVCTDLRISSIVDVPNWVVSYYFPRIVLE